MKNSITGQIHIKFYRNHRIFIIKVKRQTRTPDMPVELILDDQSLFYKKQTFRRLLQPSSVITKKRSAKWYSWAKPCLTSDRVIRRLVRLSTVSWLALVILIVLVSSWRLVWSSVWSPNTIFRLLVVTVAAVVAAAIVILVGKGGGTGGGLASIATWRLAIVRVPPWNPSVSAVVGRWSWGVWLSPAVVLSSRFVLVLDWLRPGLPLLLSRYRRTWYAGCSSMHRLHGLDPVCHA